MTGKTKRTTTRSLSLRFQFSLQTELEISNITTKGEKCYKALWEFEMDKGRGIYEEGKEKKKEQDFKSYKWKGRESGMSKEKENEKDVRELHI